MITAIIMASGYSKRMGENKLLLNYKGKLLIEHTIDTVLQCDFLEVILVAREVKIIKIAKNKGLKVIKNENAVKGISESIKLGIRNADESEGYMFFTADQPLLDVDTIKVLLSEFKENKSYIFVPKYQGKRGSPVIFPEKFKKAFLELEGDVGGKTIINKHLDQVRFVSIKDHKKMFDIDTPEDYYQILEWERTKEYV